MATEGVNITEDAEMAECEGDKVVTMMDVLQEQQEFEEDANAVLGASDDKNCTYAKGYIKRQAIYACLTCCPDVKTDPTKRAGVCLACSLMCHENHELVELYTKRNFRCDCGNPKFTSHPCQFTPNKPDLNDDNVYNQNFSGLYCICHRPYPDPEATTEDDMIQCIICEDWLHASHLDAVVPANDQYAEMICKGCMEKNDFLHDYSNFAVNTESVDVDILTVNGDKSSDNLCNGDAATDKVISNTESIPEKASVIANGGDVDMAENTEKSQDKSTDENVEQIATKDETKQTTELDSPEVNQEKSEEKCIESDNKEEQQSQTVDEKNTNQNIEKLDENVAETTSKEPNTDVELPKEELNSESEQNQSTNTDDKSADVETNITSSDPVCEKDEQSIGDVKADEDNSNKEENADASKTEDNIDSNKTEDQLLDDIRALTSDNPLDDISKSTAEEATTKHSTENTADKIDTLESSEKEESSKETDSNIDKIEEASETKPNDNADNKETNPVSETSNIEVPDTSQPKNVETETTDDKTDSVMDAIDELLKGPTDTNENDSENQPSEEISISKDNADDSEKPKANEIEISVEKVDNNIPDNTDSKENVETDVEMADSKKQDEPPPSENKTPVDLENTTNDADVGKIDSTSEVESPIDKSAASMDVGEKSSLLDTEKEADTDKINENEANDAITNKNDLSHDENKTPGASETTNEQKRKLSIEIAEETSPKKIKLDKCVRPKGTKKVYKGATFWPSNFRQKLCTCGECISVYKDLHVLFLTDPEDTVSYYESLGKENVDGGASQYEKGLQALSSLDRIQQINALTEYNRMRDKLLDFLKSFKDRKEIVKEEDIKAFFAGMKPKREPDGVYFCR